MSNRIKGITIEIGGDTTALSKALKGVNNDIFNTQKELKDVERLLKLDPTNTNLLEQRQQLLGKAVGSTKDKLFALKDAEKQVQQQFEKGEIGEEQYRSIQREIVATTQESEKLQKQLEGSNIVLSKVGSVAAEIGKKFSDAGKAMTPISSVAAGAAAGMVAMAVKASAAADDINTLSKQTGLSTEQIQKFTYASDIIDVSMDTLTGSMSKLINNMNIAQKGTGDAAAAFKTLKVNIVNADGSLRDNQDVFNDTITALGKVKNETERDAVAMKIFGESAQKLNPLILGGADALQTLGDEAEAAGLILSQDALDAANAFNDEIDSLKATAQGTFAAIGTELATALLPMMQDLVDFFKDLSKAIRSMDGDTLQMIVTILGIVAAIAPLLIIIGKVATGISVLSDAMKLLAANPMVLVVAGIVALVAALVWIENETQLFSKTFTAIWEGIKSVVEAVVNFIVTIFTEDIPNAINAGVEFVKGVMSFLAEAIKAPFNSAISMINSVIEGVNKAIKWLNNLKLPDFLGGGSFGINISTYNKLPMLEHGGILSSGSAIVGEKRPELLSLINGKAVVQPLPAAQRSGTAIQTGGNTIHITNNNRIDASNLREVAEMKQMLDGERISMRQGYVGG